MKEKFTIISTEEKTFKDKNGKDVFYYPVTLVAKNGDILKGTATHDSYQKMIGEIADFPCAGILSFELIAGKVRGKEYDRDIIKLRITDFELE